MPAFGRDGMLKRAEIETVADYVRSLAGLPVEPKADLAAGKKIFADNCAACHGDDGKGKRELGAPNLTDAIWLYGSDKATIVDGLWNGRARRDAGLGRHGSTTPPSRRWRSTSTRSAAGRNDHHADPVGVRPDGAAKAPAASLPCWTSSRSAANMPLHSLD